MSVIENRAGLAPAGDVVLSPFVRQLHPGMGQAVAERTVLRRQPDGSFETWGDVAERVAEGNALLCPPNIQHDYAREKAALMTHIAKATILMSGRHLQHGDATQPSRNMEVYTNCGHADTQFLTIERGVAKLGDLVGETVTVRCVDGRWRPAQVKSYGQQQLYRLVFQRVGSGPRMLREERFTRNHRWLLADGSVTDDIQPGDELAALPYESELDPTAVQHGIIFGDGSAHKRRDDYHGAVASQGRDYVSVRLCGRKADLLPLFDGCGVTYPDHAKGDPVVYLGRRQFWKEMPFTLDPSYIAGFIHGWWLADGSKTEASGTVCISTSDEAAAKWLQMHAPYAGLTHLSTNIKERKEGDGSFKDGSALYVVRLRKGVRWRLLSIEPVEGGPETVYCVEEPVTKSFTLASGLVTGNCSTAPLSSLLFLLLLNGSGVGRCYDDDFIFVDWNNAPNLRLVISSTHPDFDWSGDEDVRDARHKYRGETVHWHEVEDSREGWAKAVEIWETMAWQKVYRDHTLVLDFSKVRGRGTPIGGMQNRPASGPKPLMDALRKCASIKGAGMRPWMQAMYVDHYLAECVLVGGARRAARMSTKTWEDRSVLDFIRIKRPVEYDGLDMDGVIELRRRLTAEGRKPPFSFLWSSNNSVTVDREFWAAVARHREGARDPVAVHANEVLEALAQAAYGDGTGEPGIINADRLRRNDSGWKDIEGGDFVGSKKFQVEDDTRLLLARLARAARRKPYVMITNPCGEITLNVLGGYCVIADLVPFHADSLEEAEDGFRVATRALMRVNLMDSLYRREVERTNRIGVGITGVHEFAWKFFRVGFRDLVRPNVTAAAGIGAERAMHDDRASVRAGAFWLTLARFSRAVQEEARAYAEELGVNVPHTVTTIKPAGTTSKLFGLTEGWHLPAMAQYLRWVQFRSDDPLVATYRDAGYPTRELKTYSGTTIVGFPTQPVIGSLEMGEHLVTASEATPEEQYQWLRLGERFWIAGTDELGRPLHADGEDPGNQISYTLKYEPSLVSYERFRDLLVEHQSEIRCCSVLPVADTSAYEYVPEEMISKAEYEGLARQVAGAGAREEIDFAHVDCASGACPVDFKTDGKAEPLVGVALSEGERAFEVYGYSDGSCRWCEAAVEVLRGRGHGVVFFDVKDEGRKAAFFAANPSIPRTVPQVWERVDGGVEYVGGHTDLLKHLGVGPE